MSARCLGAILAAAACISPASAADPATLAFDRLKPLVGSWRNADAPASRLRIDFSLTAGGTVLVEQWLRDGQPHSLTLYHRDGERLIATHYCPQGNQPRLALLGRADDEPIRFAFLDATDLSSDREPHLVALGFELSGADRLIRHETYRQGTADAPTVLRLIRAR